jgi:hypothetical protein
MINFCSLIENIFAKRTIEKQNFAQKVKNCTFLIGCPGWFNRTLTTIVDYNFINCMDVILDTVFISVLLYVV